MGSGFLFLDNMSDHGLGIVHKPVPMILPRFENSRNAEMITYARLIAAPFTHLVRQQSSDHSNLRGRRRVKTRRNDQS